MEWVETTARSVDEAKELALDQLGVDEDEAEFEILESPRPGLFGRVRGEARVRARVRPTQPRPKVERRDRRRRKGGEGRTESAGAIAVGDTAAETPSDADDAAVVTTTDGVGDGAPDGTVTGRRRRTARRSPEPASRPEPTDRPEPADEHTNDKDATMDTSTTPDRPAEERPDAAAVGARAVSFVEELLQAFGLEGEIELERDEDDLELKVQGEDLGLLIGPRGATLLAVQDLVRVVAQRRLGDHDTRLRLDIAGYRERRREALGRFATTVADQVVATGVARALEPMPSADRKVVHDVLSERDDVVTRSEGDDPHRRVVIAPAGD